MRSAYLSHFDCQLHSMGELHPESPKRLSAIRDALIKSRVWESLVQYQAEKAEREDLLLVHDAEYLEDLDKNAPTSGYLHLNMDTMMNPHSLDAAYRAAGAVVQAVDLVMSGEVNGAFCAVRPPGHHAEKDQAMGFCFFNNIAVGTAHALKKYPLKRVVVIDFDVHHGNGTEYMLENNEKVLICSSFQHPAYPGKRFVRDNPRVINIPLSPDTGSAEFRRLVEEKWLPAIEKFRPEFFFISAGFDAHKNDPLAEINLETDDFGWLGEKIVAAAKATAQGRTVSTLEGGYNPKDLAESVVAYLRPFVEAQF